MNRLRRKAWVLSLWSMAGMGWEQDHDLNEEPMKANPQTRPVGVNTALINTSYQLAVFLNKYFPASSKQYEHEKTSAKHIPYVCH